MKEKGIGNAFALVGGTQLWKNAGYPMEKAGETQVESSANTNDSVNKTSSNKK